MKPRILILDIETRPALAFVWGLFDQNIGLNQVVEPGGPIMVGMKWLGEKEVEVVDEHRFSHQVMWKIVHKNLCDADAVVTYNGDRFDLNKINGQVVLHKMTPLPRITSIDLYKTIKKFGFLSNKLDFASRYLGIGQKIKNNGFDLWRGWMQEDERSVAQMRRYCAGDVRLTERLYKEIRPHIPNHPYLRAELPSRGRFECPHCGSTGAHQLRGFYRTKASRTQRLQCNKCGGWSKGKQERVA